MSNRVLIIIAIVVVLGVLAAAALGLTGGDPRGYMQLRTLDSQEARWRAGGLTSYEMTLGIGCFCPFFDRMPLTVQVRNGQVVSVLDSQGQPVAPDDPVRAHDNERLMTVDGVFGYARDAIRSADETKIAYDAALGYPTNLSIDYIKLAMDDELGVTLSNVRPLP